MAAYKTGDTRTYDRRLEGAPLCFVLDRKNVGSAARCFPFDTGCIDRARAEFGLDREFKIENYDNGSDFDAPERIVTGLYGNNRNYLYGEVLPAKAAAIHPLDFQSTALHNILSSSEKNEIDERISTIELQFRQPIRLSKGSVIAIVAPDIIAVTKELKDVAAHYSAQVLKYRWRRASNSQRAVLIEEAILDFLEKRGLM